MRGNEERLLEGLRALAASETRAPSRDLEIRLRARIRSRNAYAPTLAGVGLLAGALVIAAVLRPGHSVRNPSVQNSSVRNSAPSRPPAIRVAAVAEPGEMPMERRIKRRRQPRSWRQTAPLISIPYADPIAEMDRAELVRVSMPGAQLLAWGVPIPGNDPNRMLDADLLVGEDGLARAFRLVP